MTHPSAPMPGLGSPTKALESRIASFELDPQGCYVAFDPRHRAALLARGLRGPSLGESIERAFTARDDGFSSLPILPALERALHTGLAEHVVEGRGDTSELIIRLVRVDADRVPVGLLGTHPATAEHGATIADELARLADGVLNELNNLGVGLGGAMESIRSDAPGDAAFGELLEDVRGRAEIARRLARVIRSSALGPPTQIVGLDELVGDVEARLRDAAQPAELTLELDAPGARARADADELADALGELVRNAREAGAERVVVRTRVSEDAPTTVVLEVEDDGEGMTSERAAKSLDAFVGSRKHGQGIGLTRARAVARAHCGELVLETRPGEGTRAQLCLPSAGQPAAAAAPAPKKSSLDIFVVDDAPEVRRVLDRVLRHAGHTVSQAEDGIDALEKLDEREALPDVVVLDLMMPRMDGVETYRALRTKTPTLPILITSGYHPSSLGFLTTDERASFLPKPFSPAEVITALDELMTSTS